MRYEPRTGASVVFFFYFKSLLTHLQVQTYRFQGHSPADPEHERGRKEEKRWARATQDPLAIFETEALQSGTFTKVM